VLDVIFLSIIATFCTVSDYNDCGYIMVVPTDWIDIIYNDVSTVPLDDDVSLRGFHFKSGSYDLIYVGDDFLFTESKYGCNTIWHELAHADMKLDSAEKEHIQMGIRYKCGQDQTWFIG